MRNWTIGKRLIAGFVAIVAVTFVVGAFAYWKVAEINGYATSITEDSLPGVYNIGQMEATARENYTLTLRHVIAKDAAAKTAVEADMARLVERIDKIVSAYEKTITLPRDRELFNGIGPLRADFLRVRNDVVLPASKAGAPDALAVVATQLDPAFEKYLAAVRTLVDWNESNGKQNGVAITGAVSSATFGIAAGVGIAVLLAAVLGFLIVRSIGSILRRSVGELSEGAQQVASASGQVSGAAQSLSQGATEQAASLEETSASMEEMASMTRKNAENSQQAAALVSETSRLVHGANDALAGMVSSMASIKESSDKVSKIIKTIDEIAFQTNILALNAAVEAARAGEAGMGFAVVADEVRALAQRSAQAAKDTAGLIEESIARSDEGQARVQTVSAAMSSITTSTVQVKGLVDEVSEASRQQAQGIDQVSQAIAQMEKVTQGTAATAEESAAASEELNAQAETSMEVVDRLAALVGGMSLARRETRRPAGTTAVKTTVKPAVSRGSHPSVVSIANRKKPASPSTRSAEDEIPLEDTGTYGSF